VGYGLADLSQSIFASLGLDSANNSLGVKDSRRTCLLLVDGMGLLSLNKFGEQFEIFKSASNIATLASHFPSTTVTNLTSLGTGELPGIHGMLGYTVRVPHSGVPGRLLNALKWDDRVDPVMWQRIPTLFQRATAAGITVTNIAEKRYEGSAFTEAALRGAKYVGANRMAEMVTANKEALAEPRSFTYLYTNVLDHAGHNEGVGSDKWLSALEYVAQLIKALADNAPANTDFYVTADHGMVNVGEKIILGQENRLMDGVTLVGGEPRARHIYVQDGALHDVAQVWREELQGRAEVYTKDEANAAALFGAVLSEESVDRMGDLIAIPTGEIILVDPLRIPQESAMVGHHGGMNEIETAIPLLKFL